MDDDNDPQPDPTPSFTQAATQPPRWTAVDDNLLAKVNAGIGTAEMDHFEGNLHDSHAAEILNGDLYPKRAALEQKQQAAKHFAEGEATQQAIRGASLQHSMGLTEQHMSMAALPGMVQTLPTSNGPILLAPDGKGGVQQLDVPEAPDMSADLGKLAPVTGAEGLGTPGPVGPDGLPLTNEARFRDVQDENGVTHHQRIPTIAEREAAMRGDHPGHMAVQNGPYTDTYQDGRMVSTDRPPPPVSPTGNSLLPSAEQSQAFSAAARAAVAGIANPRLREQEYARILGTMIHGHVTNAIHRADEEGRATAVQKKTDAASAAKTAKDDFDKLYKEHYGNLSAELKRIRGLTGDAKEPMPDWGADEHTMHAEAVRRATRQMADNPNRKGPVAAPAAGTAPTGPAPAPGPAPQPAPAPPPPAAPVGRSAADYKAEIERRAAAAPDKYHTREGYRE